MKALFFVLSLTVSCLASAGSNPTGLYSPIDAQVAAVQIDVFNTTTRSNTPCFQSQCFAVEAWVNGQLAMHCDAWVGRGGGREFSTPTFTNTPISRTEKVHNIKFNGNTVLQTLQDAMFIDNSSYVIYADAKNEGPTRHGGIDIPKACADQLRTWVEDSFNNGGTADITTEDMPK